MQTKAKLVVEESTSGSASGSKSVQIPAGTGSTAGSAESGSDKPETSAQPEVEGSIGSEEKSASLEGMRNMEFLNMGSFVFF